VRGLAAVLLHAEAEGIVLETDGAEAEPLCRVPDYAAC
jgi:hypothetical protein